MEGNQIYSMIDDLADEVWELLEEAKEAIQAAAQLEGTHPAQGYHRGSCVVYHCTSNAGCPFQLELIHIEMDRDARWICVATHKHHKHMVGKAQPIHRDRPCHTLWVRSQLLTWAQILEGIAAAQLAQPEGVAPTRRIVRTPINPAGQHIRVDRWFLNGTGGGYEALNLIFNRVDSFKDITTYVHAHKQEYRHFYGTCNLAYANKIVFAALEDNHMAMPYDAAQMMVDLTGMALILCQVGDADNKLVPGEVCLLLLRHFPEAGEVNISPRCLINFEDCWIVGKWSLQITATRRSQ